MAAAGCSVETVVISQSATMTVSAVLDLYQQQVVVGRGLQVNVANATKWVVVIVDGPAELVLAVQGFVDPSVPVISSKASDSTVNNRVLFPATVTLRPTGLQYAMATLYAALAFKWDSVAVLYSKSTYGIAMNSDISTVFNTAGGGTQAPIIVSTVSIEKTITTGMAQDALLSLAQNNPVGIVAFVTADQFKVLGDAVEMLKGHPHNTWVEGCAIEVHESLPLPGM
jgi:hypothetical protein